MTTAHREQIQAMLDMPVGRAARILQWALVEQRSTVEIARRLGISEAEAEALYQEALAGLQRTRRQQVDGALLQWDSKTASGKARYGGVSVELDRAPDIGVDHIRCIDYHPGRRQELRTSGEMTRAISDSEVTRITAWLRNFAQAARDATAHLLADPDLDQITAPMPLTDWPPLA